MVLGGEDTGTLPVDLYQNNTHLFANDKWPTFDEGTT